MKTKNSIILSIGAISLILALLIYKSNIEVDLPLNSSSETREEIQTEFSKTKNAKISISYKEIKIGNQVWMSENLNISTFQNGDIIPYVEDDDEWKMAISNKKPAWSYYLNSTEYGKKYGKLYNWFAISDSRGLAPEGWHIPTNYEWDILKEYLGGSKIAGSKIKSKEDWYSDNPKDESGFNALVSGIRNFHGGFDDNTAAYWSAPIDNNGTEVFDVHSIESHYDNFSYIYRESNYNGYSIRCIKNQPN